MTKLLQYLIDGVAIGSLYVLVSLGFTLVFGVMGIMNVAHADLFMIAVMVMLLVGSTWSLGIVLGSLAGIVVAALLAFLVLRVALRRLDKDQPLALFVATLGVSYFLENLVAKFVEYKTRSVPALFGSKFLILGGVRFSTGQIALLAATLTIAIGLTLWLVRSPTGRLLRAVSESPGLSEVVGIDTNRMITIAVVIAAVIAAVGGLLQANTTLAIDPFVANSISLKMFAVAVVAGVGSVPGATVIGFSLGIVESLTVGYYGSQWQSVIGLVAMVAVLMLRPQGLFGRNLRVG
jgi:branched-chain amino acid transport system permease protein